MSDSSKAVFLSYASQDAEAAKHICAALRAAGVEVWFDQSELRGGDAWDAMIRKRIKECALFVPVISANTNARAEGYFRLEWKLAVDRSHLMADDAHFIFPVVVGEVTDATARVPEKFREVQWTRLRLDETPTELATRVAKLLSGGPLEAGRPRPAAEDREGRGRRKRRDDRPVWLRYAWSVVGLAFAVYYLLGPIWRPWFKTKEKPPAAVAPPAVPTTESPAGETSEARQLMLKARALSVEKYDSTADDYTAAEDMIKRALELAPADAEIWAFSSQLNKSFQTRGFDRSPQRLATARSQAERAVKLAPDSIEAQFALGYWQRDVDPVAAETAFNKILASEPDHAGALFGLSTLRNRQGRVEESLALLEKVATQPAHAALAGYLEFLAYFSRAHFAEADRAIRRSIAVQPSANSQAGLAMVLLTWQGDADGAARPLLNGLSSMRNEPRTIWMAAQVQLCRRQPDEALTALDRLADDFIRDSWFSGPKAYWVGRAQALAGRPEAARVAWEAGLAVVRARLKDAPENRDLHLVSGELLALLGHGDEALQEARTVAELDRGRPAPWFVSPVRIYAALGRADDALPLLTKLCPPKAGDDVGWPLTPALLRLDPLWDKLRGDPRFRDLLAKTEAAAVAAAPPRDWPKHPELKHAVTLVLGNDAIAEDFKLAEEIAKHAVDQSPTDPEAVTVLALVESSFLLRNFDFRDERAAQARRYGERAIQLAPDEPEALYALAVYLVSRARDPARAETLLRRACALAPDEPRYWRELLHAVGDQRLQEAIALAEQNIARFPRDALTHYEASLFYRNAGRWTEWEREIDATLALAPIANAMDWKARAAFRRGDLAGMKTWLDRVPARLRSEERNVLSSVMCALFSGDQDYGLQALQGFANDWFMDSNYYNGPKALLIASLLERQGRTGLARLQYEAALADVRQHQQADPANVSAQIAEFWIQRGLGHPDEARAANRLFLEVLRRPYQENELGTWWFSPIPANLLIGERATALQLMREAVAVNPGIRSSVRLRLALDVRMAPFRGDPEITALLAEPEAKK